MVTKIIETPQGPALLLDRELLKLSGLASGAEIEITAQESGLIHPPVNGSFDSAFLKAVERGSSRHPETFRRLSE